MRQMKYGETTTWKFFFIIEKHLEKLNYKWLPFNFRKNVLRIRLYLMMFECELVKWGILVR